MEIEAIHKPNSLGIFYSAITQYLGFQRDSDEYKVMGMAAYGQPRFELDEFLEITSSGYQLQHRFVRGITADQPSPSKQERLFGALPVPVPPRSPDGPIEQVHFDLAASAQRQLERAVLSLLERHLAATGLDQVAIAGGVGLNCLMNRSIRQHTAVADLFVPPVCSDAGHDCVG